MPYVVQQQRSHRTLKIILAILILAVVGCAIWLFIALQSLRNTTVSENAADAAPAPQSADTKLMLMGTTFWGRRTNALARASSLGVSYPFSKLSTLSRENYNAWIGNLECPVTNNGHDSYNEDTLLKFNCDPDYLPEAAKYFSAFSLGTNHVDNWGDEGIATTKQNLKNNNIQYFGSTVYSDGENNCSVLVVPVNAEYNNGEKKTLSLPLGFCSAHGVFGIPTTDVVSNIAKYAKSVPTIVMPHMGAEYKAEADDIRTDLYHRMVDAGAEMVIADHPHWIQNTEVYNQKLIAYSLGNFMFDQTFNEEVSRGAALAATATVTDAADIANLEKWDQLAKTCRESDGNCLAQIQNAQLPKPKLSWKFDMYGTTSAGDCITRLASDAEQASILERLNWSTTKSQLQN